MLKENVGTSSKSGGTRVNMKGLKINIKVMDIELDNDSKTDVNMLDSAHAPDAPNDGNSTDAVAQGLPASMNGAMNAAIQEMTPIGGNNVSNEAENNEGIGNEINRASTDVVLISVTKGES